MYISHILYVNKAQWKLHTFNYLFISPIIMVRESNGAIDHSESQKERKDKSENWQKEK